MLLFLFFIVIHNFFYQYTFSEKCCFPHAEYFWLVIQQMTVQGLCCSPKPSFINSIFFTGGVRCHLSSGGAVWYGPSLRRPDICWWSSCCWPVWSTRSWSGRERQHHAQDRHSFRDLGWVTLLEHQKCCWKKVKSYFLFESLMKGFSENPCSRSLQ